MSSILIVDDSKFARRTMRRALEELGHTVEEATSGSEAVELYASGKHELVMLDLLMPDMDGQTALARLRQSDPRVKAIVATADIQTTTRREVEELGASALINKPIQRDELERVVNQVLQGSPQPC